MWSSSTSAPPPPWPPPPPAAAAPSSSALYPWRFLTRWADEGAKVFLEPLYRNLVDFAQQLVGRIAPMVDGEEHFHALLRDMCKDGRLFPGPPTPVIEASGEENKNTPRAKLPPRLRRLVDANA